MTSPVVGVIVVGIVLVRIGHPDRFSLPLEAGRSLQQSCAPAWTPANRSVRMVVSWQRATLEAGTQWRGIRLYY